MTWLLKLYPREWRRRYGAELEALVASQPKSFQLVVDLLGGAVDARVKPQMFAHQLDGATGTDGGPNMFTRMTGCCATGGMSRKDAFFGAGLTLGSALVVAAIMLVGDSPMAETIGLTMFPGVLAVGTIATRVRGHSTLAKVVLIGGPFVVLFLIGLLAGLLQGA
jgi:hypothetical protein